MIDDNEETKGDFERIFHDSGVEFAHFDAKASVCTNQQQKSRLVDNNQSGVTKSINASQDPLTINQNDIQARLVMKSALTSSCNIQTETDADIADSVSKVLSHAKMSQNLAMYR